MLSIKECNGGVFVYNKNHLFTGDIVDKYGEYSPEEIEVLKLIVKPGDTVVEAGSNIGLITIPLCKMVGEEGVVLSYEAHPETYKLLMANIHINGVDRPCWYRNEALLDEYGPTSIASFSDTESRNVGGITVGHGDLTVFADTLDSWADSFDFDLIKLDIEGNELKALRGAVGVINRDKPVLYVEDHEFDIPPDQNNPAGRKSNSAELREFIGSLGYQIFKHQPQLTRQLDIVSHNLLCFHKDDKRRDEFFSKVQQ